MKSIVSRFLVISLLSISFLNTSLLTSFASSGLDVKEIASKSDAVFDINDTDTYFQDVDYLAGNELPSVVNTVSNRSDIIVALGYYTNKDMYKQVRTTMSSSGYFSFTKPSDFSTMDGISFFLYQPSYSVLPKPGNYRFQIRFGSNTGGVTWRRCTFYRRYSTTNASSLVSRVPIDNLQQFSGDFFSQVDLKIVSNPIDTFEYVIYPDSSSFSFPFGGYASFNFTPLTTASSDAVSTSPLTPSSDEIQNNISDSVGNISSGVDNINNSINSGVDSINGNLEEIIRTISMQLEAFWNQLYNLVHLDDNKNRDENTKKITDKLDQTNKNLDVIDTDILDGFDSLEKNNDSNSNSIINNNNQNTSSIINNNNENTDKLANGYDNSSMIENNDKLAGKLDEYEKLENELLSDTKDNLNNFQFENPFLSFNAVMSDISYILTSIYNGLGSFNIPIAFSMTLTIAMLCIGWYRFKAGG